MTDATAPDAGTPAPPAPDIPWRPLPARLSFLSLSVTLPEPRLQAWALTLEARGIPCRAEADGGGWRLLVPRDRFPDALRELRRYEAENRNWPPPLPPAAPAVDNTLPTLAVLALLGTFHNLLHLPGGLRGLPAEAWTARGSADAAAIRAGEWWRAVTALTLHADGLHLLGNLCFGGLFVVLLCRVLGSGLGWSLILASGAGGNLLNAWLQAPAHRAVGASTAVFGAVGLLAAIGLLHGGVRPRRRWYLPLAAALALLALLGSEGANTDLGAHLFGLAAGVALGLPAGRWLGSHGPPGRVVGALLALTGLLVVIGAWWRALAG